MPGAFALLILLLFLTGCAQKVRITELLQKNTLDVKLVLVENDKVPKALQKVALQTLENLLRDPPLDVKTKMKLLRKEVYLNFKGHSVEPYYDPVETARRHPDTDIVIVMEVKQLAHKEERYKLKEEDPDILYHCVERKANANALFNVILTKSGEVVFAKAYEGSFYKRYCDEKTYRPEKLPKPDYMMLKALEKAQLKFVRDFYDLL